MSGNRSVQAAQRRRAGPTSEPSIPGRGPQPSINSSQMFANQSKSGYGQNIPNGRLAGQHAAMQQTSTQQQSYQESQQKNKLSSVNKMTIAQAITLITLRLGVLESKLHNTEETYNVDGNSSIDLEVLQSILTRLESLESTSSSSSDSSNNIEFNVLKQNIESTSQIVTQCKQTANNLIKDNLILRTQMDNLKKELAETKTLLQNLVVVDNSKKSTNDESTNTCDEVKVTELQNNIGDSSQICTDPTIRC